MKRLVYILAVLLLMTACHTQKTGQVPHRREGKKQVLEQVVQHQPVFQTAKAAKVRFSIRYEERLITASGTINIYTDSAILVSVQPMLGIEMLRIELTPQAVVVVDKMNRRFVRMTFGELQKKVHMPVSFQDIQALCTNRLFVIGKEPSRIPDLNFRLTQEDGHWLLQHNAGLLRYTYVVGKDDYALQQTELSVPMTNYTAQVCYRQPETVDGVYFPQVIELIFNLPKLTGSCTISLQRLCFECNVNVKPLELDRYKQVNLSTLLSK